MRIINFTGFFVVFLSSMLVFSCKKDTIKKTDPPADLYGSLKVVFDHGVDDKPFAYNTDYINQNGDTFNIQKFMYYVSKVVLTKEDNTTFSEPESYHLIHKQNNLSNNNFTIQRIPLGKYKSITYIIGVDSARNVSGAQEYDLSPSEGMFWSWFTGYIMFKLEGKSPQSGSNDGNIIFHIGGFGGNNNAIRKVTINFPTNLVIEKDKTPTLKLHTNVNEVFKNPNTISFADDYFIMSAGLRANTFSNNYADMTTFKEIIQ